MVTNSICTASRSSLTSRLSGLSSRDGSGRCRRCFSKRHNLITQAFIPLNGDAFVTVVAPADAPLEDGLPAHSTLRAFIVPGDVGIQLFRSTWHENPFPLRDDQTFLVTSHQALTRGHQQNPDANLAQLPLDLERCWFKEAGIVLNVQLP